MVFVSVLQGKINASLSLLKETVDETKVFIGQTFFHLAIPSTSHTLSQMKG